MGGLGGCGGREGPTVGVGRSGVEFGGEGGGVEMGGGGGRMSWELGVGGGVRMVVESLEPNLNLSRWHLF